MTRSYGLRVRRMGVSTRSVTGPSLVAFGRVSLQLSQGADLFLSFSSYVLPKLELRRLLPGPCNAATRGLSGGVSVDGDGMEFGGDASTPLCLSTEMELFRLALVIAASPSAGFKDRELLGRRELMP